MNVSYTTPQISLTRGSIGSQPSIAVSSVGLVVGDGNIDVVGNTVVGWGIAVRKVESAQYFSVLLGKLSQFRCSGHERLYFASTGAQLLLTC